MGKHCMLNFDDLYPTLQITLTADEARAFLKGNRAEYLGTGWYRFQGMTYLVTKAGMVDMEFTTDDPHSVAPWSRDWEGNVHVYGWPEKSKVLNLFDEVAKNAPTRKNDEGKCTLEFTVDFPGFKSAPEPTPTESAEEPETPEQGQAPKDEFIRPGFSPHVHYTGHSSHTDTTEYGSWEFAPGDIVENEYGTSHLFEVTDRTLVIYESDKDAVEWYEVRWYVDGEEHRAIIDGRTLRKADLTPKGKRKKGLPTKPRD